LWIASCAFTRLTLSKRPKIHQTSVERASRSEADASDVLANFGGFVLALQALAAALDGGDELRKVDLERVEDLVGVVLRAEPDLALSRSGVLDDVLGGALGLLGDLLLADQALLALARVLDRACLISSGIVARIWSRMS